MACINNPISQSSLQISPIWIPLIRKEVTTRTEDQEGGWRVKNNPYSQTCLQFSPIGIPLIKKEVTMPIEGQCEGLDLHIS
jgi:hypothetical protein